MYLVLIPVLNMVEPTELIMVLAIVLLLFGAKRHPRARERPRYWHPGVQEARPRRG